MQKSLHCICAIEGTFCEAVKLVIVYFADHDGFVEAVAVDVLFRSADVIVHHIDTRNSESAFG